MQHRLRFAASVLASLLVIAITPACTRSPATQPADGAFKTLTLKAQIDPAKPTVNLEELGLQADQIDAVKLEQDGKRVVRTFDFAGNQLLIQGVGNPVSPVLDLEKPYTLKLYAADNSRYRIDFITGALPAITETNSRQVVFVPAMPEKGFHWPYFLAIPRAASRSMNEGHRRYLMVDTTNTGSSNNVSEMIAKARAEVEGQRQSSMSVAETLGMPMLFPAFPRPQVGYNLGGETNQFYTHALDRDTAKLHVNMRDPKAAEMLTAGFKNAGFDVNTMLNLDLQLNAMIDHAIAYMNQYGHNVQPKQVFLSGYSASGTFTDRYALLHPDRVRAIASGATLDDMALPLAEHKGQNLIFPIGVSDYQEITGRSFDLTKHNQVARLIFMGEDDRNSTLPYGDCYGERERQIITGLWGTEVLPRAQALTQLYGESGGKGIFILDKGQQHGMSADMQAYIKAFFEANRDSDKPVYPKPAKPEQLKFTLFE